MINLSRLASKSPGTGRLRLNLNLFVESVRTSASLEPRLFAASLALHLTVAVGSVLGLLCIRTVIRALESYPDTSALTILPWSALLAATMGTARAATILNSRTRAAIGKSVDRVIEQEVVKLSLLAPTRTHDDQNFLHVRERGAYSVSRLSDKVVAAWLGSYLPLAAIGSVLVSVSWLLPATVAIASWVAYWTSKRMGVAAGQQRRIESRSQRQKDSLADALFSDSGALERYFHGVDSVLYAAYLEAADREFAATKSGMRSLSRLNMKNSIYRGMANCLVYSSLGFAVFSGAAGVADVGMAVAALAMARRFLKTGASASGQIAEEFSSFEELVNELGQVDRDPTCRIDINIGAKAPVVTFSNVSFRYPSSEGFALEGVSFSAYAGQVVLVLGANGAGKSTALRLATSLFQPTQGRVSYSEGFKPPVDIAYLGADSTAYPVPVGALSGELQVAKLSVEMGGEGLAPCRPGGKSWRFDCSDHLQVPVGNLSTGQLRRMELTRTMSKPARLVILDEPTRGLDVASVQQFFRTVRETADLGVAVVLADHSPVARTISDVVVVLDDTEGAAGHAT
ncbi:ATP-binding cassette domain-containing protein [Nocardioides carbamazepini]|uniref:ATP-binding cassette domain-containing protein n=1 Tax=Nocardioides carbamazepini TaxID=2854259 RepID=UPI002149CDC3|nr:ATP-binding cassette domain-containing protein [Nocardioides carbamazepini]MCR1785884.1 ATP-binding cassette domain-containing protein [Nocardioides carbamazepini]